MSTTIIDRLYSDNNELIKYLKDKGEISFQSSVEDNFRKTLLLAAASYFESLLTDSLKIFCQKHTVTAVILYELIRSKAIERQYHTYFEWKENNANRFFALFGDEFKQFIKQEITKDEDLDKAIKAFMEIGKYRNLLVHENFANYDLPQTQDEIYRLYQQALKFVEAFPVKLEEYSAKKAKSVTETT